MYLSDGSTTTTAKKPSAWSTVGDIAGKVFGGIFSTGASILNGVGKGMNAGMTNPAELNTTIMTTELKPDYTPLIVGGVGVVALLGVAIFVGRK